MDEPNKASQSTGAERSANHPKPFFYVQPPLQPFYTYQWQMNHPYGHQSFPGSGFPMSRPYMVPYSYMHYPSYVMPQPAMHPVDYRRLYERNFPHAVHRETTCVGAQTEPCDALNKLIECLDQLRSGDSSQTSASSSSLTEESKTVERKLMSEREAGHHDGEHLPFDEEEGEKHGAHSEKHLASSQMHPPNPKKRGEPVQRKDVVETKEEMEWHGCTSQPSSCSSPDRDLKSVENPEDVSCCILSLPFDKVLSSGVYGSSVTPTSVSSALSYNYNPPTPAHERVSVLSPSLDELSSHDELLSTDIDDIDLFQSRIHNRGKLAEVTSRKGHELCLLYPKRLQCSKCGSHTFKQLSRTKTYSYNNVEDSDDVEGRVTTKACERCLRCATMKGHVTKKMHSLLKPRLRPSQKRENAEDQHETSHSECYYCEKCMSSPEKSSTPASRGAQPERRFRPTSDQLFWENIRGNGRSNSCRSQPLPQRQQRLGQRKSRFKSQVCQESRTDNNNNNNNNDDDDEDEGQELHQYHKGKGITKRGGARC